MEKTRKLKSMTTICKHWWNGSCDMTMVFMPESCEEGTTCVLYKPRNEQSHFEKPRYLILYREAAEFDKDYNDWIGDPRRYLTEGWNDLIETVRSLERDPDTKIEEIYEVSAIIPLKNILIYLKEKRTRNEQHI